MDHIFKLQFQFNQKAYTAWVSLRPQGYDLSFYVHYNEQDLHRLLPGGNLVFNLSQGLLQPASLHDPSAEELLYCTTEAIAAYIQRQKE